MDIIRAGSKSQPPAVRRVIHAFDHGFRRDAFCGGSKRRKSPLAAIILLTW
ncbi:MAG: hypothetical protein LBG43_11335 [Treponema sp.]|nr:hypothetical protein [Treponema sp.]